MAEERKYSVEEVAKIARLYSNLNAQSVYLIKALKTKEVLTSEITTFEQYLESYEKNVPEEVRKVLNEGEIQNLKAILSFRKEDLEKLASEE